MEVASPRARRRFDSWATYDTTVNGLITSYWNDEASSDATKTESINAAGVTWGDAMASAWTAYDNAAAAASAQQTLDDAQSASDAWHDIHAAYTVKLNADAAAGNAYTQASIDAESSFYTTVVPEWVTYSDAMTDASTAHSVAGNNAYAAAVGRWASAEGGPFSAFTAAIEAAEAAHDNAMVEAYGVRLKELSNPARPAIEELIPTYYDLPENQNIDHLRASFFDLKKQAAAGVDGNLTG